MSQTATKADGATTADSDRAPSIERAGKHKWGYSVSQVDDFLDRTHSMYESSTPLLTQEDIQLASFDLEKNGYVISQVDAVLIRLERAVVDKRTQYSLSSAGQDAWQDDLLALARTLQERAEAEPKQRFARGVHRQPSYDMKQVDQIVSQAWTRIAGLIGITTSAQPAEGAQEITARRVSNVIFTQRKGRHGYGEASVDAYLNRCVQVLTRMESFERVSGRPLEPFASSTGMSDDPAVAQAVDHTAGRADAEDGIVAGSAQQENAGTAASMPISYDGPSAVADGQATMPQTYAPLPRPSVSARPMQAIPPQSQEPGQGSAGLASLVSVPSSQEQDLQDSLDPQDSPSHDALVHSGSPAASAAEESATSVIGDLSGYSHEGTEEPAAVRPQERQDVTAAHHQSDQQTGQNQQAGQKVYTDLQAVTDEPSGAGTDAAQAAQESGSGYISSLLSNPVAPTGSFEIPDLTFPVSHPAPQKRAGDDQESGSSSPDPADRSGRQGHGTTDGDTSE